MRVLAISAIAIAGLVLVMLIALHTNPVQGRILEWSIRELERRFDLNLIADNLHFNLASRRVVMTNVRLAAVGHRDQPFFTANAVMVQLPWAAYRGMLRFEEVTVDRGVVTIIRDVNDVSNLPPGRGRRDPNLPPRKIDVRALMVRDLDFLYHDFKRDVEIRAPGIQTDLAYDLGEGASGPFSIGRGVDVRIGERRVTVDPVTGHMVFDGSNVELTGVKLDTSDGNLTLSGVIDRTLDEPTLNLAFKGTTDISRAAKWTTTPVPVAGPATIDATMTGAPTEFVLDAHVVAAGAQIGREKGVAFDAQARVTPDSVSVSRSTITPATGGSIQASVDFQFAETAPWWIDAKYQGIDAAAAFRLGDLAPLPFGAALTGTARLDGSPGQPFRLQVNNRSAPRAAAGTAPIDGEVEFAVEGTRWRADQRHRMGATTVEGGIGGIWNRETVTQSTFDGTLAVRSGDVGEAARYAALFGLATPEIVRTAKGPLDAEVQMSGTFIAPRFVGSMRSAGLDIPSLGTTALAADFDASERRLDATNIEATIATATTVRGEVRADLVTRALQGELKAETPKAAELMAAVPEALRLDGPLAATVTLAGTVDEPAITADVTGSGLMLAGQPIDSLTAKTRLVGEGINVEPLTLRQGSGVLSATGRYEWSTRTYKIDLNGQDLQWRGTLARLGDAEARFGVKFSGSGDIDRPTGEGVVDFAVSGGLAGQLIDKGIVNVRLNGENALVTAHVPLLGAFLSGTVVPRQPFAYDAVVVMNRVDLKPVMTLAGLDATHVSGTASLSASAQGELSNVTASRAFINLQDIQADVAEVPVRLALPSRLSWDGGALNIDTLDVTIGSGKLHASGRLGPEGIETAKWQSTFTGELGDLIKLGRPFGVPGELQGSGPVNIVFESTGGLERSTATVRLANGTLGWLDLPAIRDLVLDANFDGATLNVTRLTGMWQDGGIEGVASIPRAVLEGRDTGGSNLPPGQAGFAKLRVIGLSETALAPWLSPTVLTSIDGRVSATLDARIMRPSIEGVSGTIAFDEADFTLAGVKVTQVSPSILYLEDGVLTLRDVSFNAGGSPLTLTGTARLAPADKQGLDLDVAGTVDLRIVSAFSPTIATDGEAKLNVGIGGPFKAPVFNGRVDLEGAELALREPRILVSEVNGTIALDGQRVLFDNVRGSLNGGLLTLDGGFLLEGFTPGRGGLTVVVDSAALEYPASLQSEVDALITLAPGPTGWTLTGDINVERSVYNEPISLPSLIAARRGRAPTAAREPGWLEELRLNLFVTTLQDMRLDNNYGRIEAGAGLRVLGTADDPVLSGRITLREGGEVYLAGNRFHITRGSISFTNPHRISPEFDIEMRTLIAGTDITLTLEGPLDRLETDVRSSDPTIDSREAMSMLFGGAQGEDAVALFSGELLGATGRAIGIDALRVERGFETDEFRADPGLIATSTDPSTRLTLTQRLRPDTELTLSQSLRESGALSAIISYKPRRNVELRVASRDNVDRSVAIRHEITFGGGETTEIDPRDQPEITEVSISGQPGRPPEELIALLELEPGDRYDFHRWQRDVDRLRELYHELNHYEVRVRGTRQISEDGLTVALNYEIDPGPVADLVIEGHPLEPELEDDIREAWRRTIFDRFLLEDIRTRILRHLIEEDYIGSTVDAQIAVATPERKQIKVAVTAGPQVSRRRVEYSGNYSIDADRLDTVIHDAVLDVDGWLDTGRLAEALETYYQSQAYLAVTVKAEPPIVQGDEGVLPVTIDEGRRFVIGRLTFPGVSPNRLAEVAAAVAIDSSVPYVLDEIDAAQRRLEDYYAERGFSVVQIEVDAEPDLEAGTVAIEFAVLEGLQQILREVVTSGATRTRDGVIRRALRLRIGAPVNLAEWSQARKRLYDTNVFRQVDIEPVPVAPTTEESAAGVEPVRAVVRVVEYPVWRLRYGLQFTDEREEFADPDGDTRLQSLGVLADLQNQNVFGRAITAGIAGRYERNRQAGSLFTSNSSFFGLPIRTSGFIFYSRQRFIVGDQLSTIDERVGLSAEQRWRPHRDSELIWSYRFEREQASSNFGDIQEVPPVMLSRLNVAALFDRRDSPADPKRGWFSAVNWEQSVEILGSDYGSGKILAQHSMYRALGRLVLAGRGQLGTGYGGEALIPSERFLLGGATTVRGYGENTLGPRTFLGEPAGGEALLALNGELRFPVRGWVQGVGFVDAGQVFANRSDLGLRELAVGYGFGLRLVSPYAIFRVDFGIPASTLTPDRPANQFKSGRWYFGIGHIF